MIAQSARVQGASRARPALGRGPVPRLTILTRDATAGRSRSELDQPAVMTPTGRVLDTRIEYVPHPSFDDPAARRAILGPMPESGDGEAPRRVKFHGSLHPSLANLCEVPPLSGGQEAHLFRKMNCLKFLAARLRDRIDPARPHVAELAELERFLAEALTTRNRIIEANQRLVVSIARKQVGPGEDPSEWVSDGNLALMRAVEKFDFARGNKFSTYATWSVRHSFFRIARSGLGQPRLSFTGSEDDIEADADPVAEEHEREEVQDLRRETVRRLLTRLEDRERRIIVYSYGMGGAAKKTLKQVGLEIGVSKERVRQLETHAHDKLRRYANEGRIELDIA